MRRFGLIGFPLGHSFSKKYFEEKFRAEKLDDCSFDLFPISSIYELPNLIQEHADLEGLSVTIPYKQLVLRFLDSSRIPEGVRACNCVRIEDRRLVGFNTDIIGFEKSFTEKLAPGHSRALVLGNGGATEAVVYVLKKLGIAFEIVSRRLHDGSTLTYTDLNEDILATHTIIINCTPLGTFPEVTACPDIPYNLVGSGHYLFDLVYNPPKTLFLEKGEQRGATIKNGADMLAIQAEASWKIWNEPLPEAP